MIAKKSSTKIKFDPCVSSRVRRLLQRDKNTPEWARDLFRSMVQEARKLAHPKDDQSHASVRDFIMDLELLITAAIWHYQDATSECGKGIEKGLHRIDPDVEFCVRCGSMVIKRILLDTIAIKVFGRKRAARRGGCFCDCVKRTGNYGGIRER